MTIKLLTLFPEMFDALNHSIIGRAINKNVVKLEVYNIRDYTFDKHNKCDDIPFGGGAGMVMTPQPIVSCVNTADPNHEAHRIFMSPRGKILSVKIVKELADINKDILILCGHYEGVDQRAIDLTMDDEISIGDYILTGGELPAMVLVDSLLRFVPQVLGSSDSAVDESFSDGLLEYPQYTRPQEFSGLTVPDVLISGHHANIAKWRKEQSILITKANRPDLLK